MGNSGCKEVWFSLRPCLISSLDLSAIIKAFYERPVIPAVPSPLKPLHSISGPSPPTPTSVKELALASSELALKIWQVNIQLYAVAINSAG